MMEIYDMIYDIVFSGDYSLIFRLMIITLSFSMMINVLRFVLGSIGSCSCSGDEDASESDNGKKVDLTKKNNIFTKYYDHYDQD